ncbi:MAG: AAA family ATPase [Rhodospirillales bacterium]|nr:AAA family ATPase [Rhodospirillales bacterium]
MTATGRPGNAHIIVVGNEKGGTGKSTVSMHLTVGLLHRGLSVATIDLDARQATLSRYIENRRNNPKAVAAGLAVPEHVAIRASEDRAGDEGRLREAIARLRAAHDVVLIDTPGSDNYLSRVGHSYADTLVTPLNDSLIDLDVLAAVDPATMRILRPSHYSEMVWETKKQRALRGERGTVDWVVMRNRLSSLDARNKRDMHDLLETLSRRIGFRTVAGLGERVVYRALFLDGLTLLDLRDGDLGHGLSLSHVAARQELRALLHALDLPHRNAPARV